MDHSAQMGSLSHETKTREHAVAADSPVAER